MSLFDLSRVWDVCPRLAGNQVLRNLFRQAPTHSSEERVCGVFMTRSHLLVASQTDGDRLYIFSVCGDEAEEDCLLPLTSGGGKTVAVACLEDEYEVCVVRERGQLELFSQWNCSWRKTEDAARLTEFSVLDCAFHLASHSVVYCVSLPGQPHTHSILTRSYQLGGEGEEGRQLCLKEPTLLLCACPASCLWPWDGGLAVQPLTGPPGLLLLWSPQQPSQLQPFILNSHSPVAPSPHSTHYPRLCLQLAPLWTRAPQDPWIASVTVSGKQLLLLLSSGEVVTMETHQRSSHCRCVTKLRDFDIRYPLLKSHKTGLHLFVLHTYYGIFSKGELRMYERFCGEMVWESDEHEGRDITLLAPPTSQHWIGIYGNSGVWVLRSRRISEHTHLLSQALFPITTNADETTPGDFLEHGRVLAATLYQLWSHPLPATKSALEALHGIVQRDRQEDTEDEELFLPLLSSDLQSLLTSARLQSPALLVALLAEHPRHMQFISDAVQRFLTDKEDNCATPLTNEVAVLLRQYQTLCQAYNSQLTLWKTATDRHLLLSPSASATSLLHRLESCHDNERVGLRAQLQMLSCRYPSATLSGIRTYFTVPSFNTVVEEIKGGGWKSDRDWKSILGTEAGSGLRRGVLEGVALNVPLFELTCRLLYSEQPSELMDFVTFAQLARDCQAQGDSSFARRCRKSYFFQRAAQCLPKFLSPETTPTSREALLAHSSLLLKSGSSGCQTSSLGLLLRGKLWEDALSFVEHESTHNSHMYCALFHSLLVTMVQAGVLHCFIDRVWQLLPQTFSVFDLLSVLSSRTLHLPPPLLVHDHSSLTVTDIRDRLQQLLNS